MFNLAYINCSIPHTTTVKHYHHDTLQKRNNDNTANNAAYKVKIETICMI